MNPESQRDGFELSVINGTGIVRRVLRETGVDGVLPLRDDTEDGVRPSP